MEVMEKSKKRILRRKIIEGWDIPLNPLTGKYYKVNPKCSDENKNLVKTAVERDKFINM